MWVSLLHHVGVSGPALFVVLLSAITTQFPAVDLSAHAHCALALVLLMHSPAVAYIHWAAKERLPPLLMA